MLVANFAIELTRTRPLAIAAALHPGTVDSGLSAPFQGNVPEGRLFTPDVSALPGLPAPLRLAAQVGEVLG